MKKERDIRLYLDDILEAVGKIERYTEDGFACLRMYNIDGGKIVWKDIKRMNLTKEEIDEFLLLPVIF